MMRSLSLTVFLGISIHLASGATDLTIVAGTIGEDVVDSTIDKIKDSCVFQNDYLFLKRLAYVSSQYGQKADTYRSGYDGGIWQIDLLQYDETQGTTFNDAINMTFGIDWSTSTWSDLRKPLFSGIAMMLLIEQRSSSVPKTILEQGEFYESELNGNESNFNALVSVMPSGCLSDNLDMAFLIDASGSIGSSDYVTSKQFVADILDAFTIDTNAVRVAVTTFSSNVNTYVYFEDQNSKASLQQTIMNLPYDARWTKTGLGLDHLRTDVFANHTGMRPASAKIAIIQTDGKSQDTTWTLQAAQNLREVGVTLFAIGVGSNTNVAELDGIATSPTCRHVRQIADFQELHAIISDINEVACGAIVEIADPIDTDLTCNQDVTVSVQIADGKTMVVVGDIPLYGSFDVSRPSSALSTFSVNADSAIPTMIYLPASGETLFMTFDTSNCTGDFVLQVLDGNQLEKTGTATLCSKALPDGSQELQNCTDIDYVTSNNFTTDAYADSFCASSSLGYHPHPDTTLKYIYCDDQDSYTVDCPAGFAYVHAHEDCSAPASTEPNEICDICTASNLRMNRKAFPLATNDYQYVECSDEEVCELEECASEFVPEKQTCKAEKELSAFCKFLLLFTGTLPSWC